MKSKVRLFFVSLVVIASLVLIFFIITADNDSAEIGTSATTADTTTATNETTNTNQIMEIETMSDSTYGFPGVLPDERIKGKKVRITTSKGDIVFELYPDDAPKAVSNFVYLTEEGYYNGLTFHRVEPGFVIQGGDPEGSGAGGPGYQFEDEVVTKNYDQGIVAMANSGPNTNGSQFFVILEDKPDLPKQYTIFGKVTEGIDIVNQIVIGDVMTTVTVESK